MNLEQVLYSAHGLVKKHGNFTLTEALLSAVILLVLAEEEERTGTNEGMEKEALVRRATAIYEAFMAEPLPEIKEKDNVC